MDNAEAYSVVRETAGKMHAVLADEMKKVPEKQQWVISSRIINLLFAGHFQVTLIRAENEVNRMEAQALKDEVAAKESGG